MARITATACQRYAAQYTADSIRIGEYNRDAKAWPVRAFIGGECMAPGSRRFTGIQSDYMVIADGFGGWKVAQKGDFVVATPQLAPLPSLDGVWQVGSANLYFQLLDYDSAEGYLVSLGRRGADSAISWQQTNNLQPVAFFHGAKLRGQIGEGFYELELIGQNGLRLSEHQEYGVEATALHRVGIGRAEGTATPAK